MSHPRRRRPNTWAERLYEVVVRLYPRRFREEYGASLKQVFRELLDDDTIPAWRVWLTVLGDLPGSVVPEHLATLRREGAMELSASQRLLGNPFVRQGAAFGVVMGLIWIAYSVLNNTAVLDSSGYALLNNGVTVALALLFGVAGLVGARTAKSIRAGTYTGVAAAVVGSVIGIAAMWITTFVYFEQSRHNPYILQDFHRSGETSLDAFIIDDTLGASFFGPLGMFILGITLGTLGGVAGKLTRQLRPQ
jgi:hypothetical protein